MGWGAAHSVTLASALVVFGVCRASALGDRDAQEQAEQDTAARFAEQAVVDLAFTTITRDLEEPTT